MMNEDELIEESTGVILEDENSTINMHGKDVADVLGLNNVKDRSLTQSVRHYEVDIDMYDDLYDSSSVIQNSVSEGTKDLPIFDKLNKDMFLSLFKYQPEIVPESKMKQSTRINNRIMRKLVDTPEYKGLRKNCKLDLFNSALGTEIIGEKAVEIIHDWKQEALDKYNQRKQQNNQNGNGTPGGNGNGGNASQSPEVQNPFEVMDKLSKAEEELDDLLDQQKSAQEILEEMKQMGGGGSVNPHFQNAVNQIEMDLNTAQQVADAISKQLDDFIDENDDLVDDLATRFMGVFSEADTVVADTSDLIEAWGLDEGDGCRVPFSEKREAVERIRDSKKLKDLTKLIGRFKESAITDQKKKSKDGGGSVKSIKTGNKIERVLPSEKLKLCNDVTKKDFYRQYNQKELLQYELDSHKKKSQGPIITCIDTSGSMEGSREKWSKAIAIAMLEIAHIQKRDYAAVIFDNKANEPIIIEKDKIEPTKLLDIAETFLDGGTNFKPPLEKALNLIKQSKFRKADIVFITDGESSISPEFKAKFNQVKEDKEFNVMSICINTGRGRVNTKSLDEFSDEVIMLSNVADLADANSEIAHHIFSGV